MRFLLDENNFEEGVASRRRKRYQYCCEELAPAVYYRHMSDVSGNICPGRSQPNENLDSTFDFGSSSSEDDQDQDNNISNQAPDNDIVSLSDSDSSTSSGVSEMFSDMEEVWDSCDDDDVEVTTEVENFRSIMFVLSIFLNFFQFAFRTSERAMLVLLKFLRIFLVHLSTLLPGTGLLEYLHSNFPKSLYSIRKVVKYDDGDFMEYVVCPKCFKLYEYSECIIKVGSKNNHKNVIILSFQITQNAQGGKNVLQYS